MASQSECLCTRGNADAQTDRKADSCGILTPDPSIGRTEASKRQTTLLTLTPLSTDLHTHTHTRLTALFRDYLGQPVPER